MHSNFFPSRSKGFTLIELLMVIAIIGILSSVVLANLNNARQRGGDAAVKSNLANVRSQAELYYDSHTYSYGTQPAGLCPTAVAGAVDSMFEDTRIITAIAAANSAGGGGTAGTRCWTNGQNYVATVRLKSMTGQSWCIDHTGVAKQVPYLTTWSYTACP